MAGASASHLAPGGRTFLRQAGGSLHLAIFYAPPVIAELERNDPRRTLNERNISALITFIEEIAHGVQAALLFMDGNRAIESEAYARNLETQARVDTYLVLSKFAQVLCGGRIPRRVGAWLRRQLFDDGHRHFATPVLRFRYRIAQECALGFIRHLRRLPMDKRPSELRRFRGLEWPEKCAFAKADLVSLGLA